MTLNPTGSGFCNNCGAQCGAQNNFCPKCGMRILRAPAEGRAGLRCGDCGHVNHDEAGFCVHCSADLPKDVALRELDEVMIAAIMREQVDFENHRDVVGVINKIIKKKIIIDLSNVKWMDSTGIGMLVSFTYRTARTKQEVKIIGLCDKIRDAMRALQVDNVLEIYIDLDAALASWGISAA